jgi:hypothetical protein
VDGRRCLQHIGYAEAAGGSYDGIFSERNYKGESMMAKFYAVATAAIVMMIAGIGFVGNVDNGAPIFTNYLIALLLWGAAFILMYIAEAIVVKENIYFSWEDDDVDE